MTANSTGSKRGQDRTAKPPKVSMMDQFWAAKKEHPGCVLFFRMGDFYELFHDDAKLASKELGITLTARSKGAEAVPMAGVPVRSLEGYLFRLINKGHKVAICEQLTDPRTSKGIVERGVVRVVTPGTITEENALNAREPNFLASLHLTKEGAGLAWVDVSTGRFRVTEVPLDKLLDELTRIRPAEILCAPSVADDAPELSMELTRALSCAITEREQWRFESRAATRAMQRQFKVKTLAGFGIADESPILPAAGALVEYLEETQKQACQHIARVELVRSESHLVLDRATQSCLELLFTQREGRPEGSLLATLDKSRTAMGGRLLREWLLSPLIDVEAIKYRQLGVAEFVGSPFLRDDVRAQLGEVLDIERIAAKVSTGRANARDLLGLANSLAIAEPLREKLKDTYSKICGELHEEIDPLQDVVERIQETLVDEPPTALRDGGLIRAGFDAELDELRQIAGDGKTWIASFQAKEAESTGINGLKIGFNSVFGYFLDVPRGQVNLVPENWIRKQTIKNSERYVTPELKEFEGKVLKAEDRSKDLEYDMFVALREATAHEIRRILATAQTIATVDVLAGLAQIAHENHYVAPEVDDSGDLEIIDGRHPVVERMENVETFVPNDSHLNLNDRMLTVLTGPNMAGKSTYIRQTALIVLMAQIGSFVPASEARIGVVDRIFTRIGSADDIGRGESTFMVEMVEIANILNNATDRSLVVLDEVGRGTSTFDGLALAWAICEELHERIGARTLFATHYHQLTDLASRLKGVCNRNVAVRELDDEIVFLHKIVEGGTDRSYGIHVARLAGVPDALLERARTILLNIESESEDLAPRIAQREPQANDSPINKNGGATSDGQLNLFAAGPSATEAAIAKLDLSNMTPLEALMKLHEIQQSLPNR